MKIRKITVILFVGPVIVASVLAIGTHFLDFVKKNAFRAACAKNMSVLSKALREYADEYGKYPTPDKWCDLLQTISCVSQERFLCRISGSPKVWSSEDSNEEQHLSGKVILLREYNDVNGRHKYLYSIAWSNYAINPDVEPNSPKDVVLLFETKGGWNQFGGEKLLTFDNHLRIGTNVLFHDGIVRFIKPKDVSKLNWGKGN